MDLICRWLYVCVCVWPSLKNRKRMLAGCGVRMMGCDGCVWTEECQLCPVALPSSSQPVTLTNTHWGIPINTLHNRNQSWMNHCFNYLPFCVTLFLVFSPFLLYTVCKIAFTTQLPTGKISSKATNLYHLGNVTVSTL